MYGANARKLLAKSTSGRGQNPVCLEDIKVEVEGSSEDFGSDDEESIMNRADLMMIKQHSKAGRLNVGPVQADAYDDPEEIQKMIKKEISNFFVGGKQLHF